MYLISKKLAQMRKARVAAILAWIWPSLAFGACARGPKKILQEELVSNPYKLGTTKGWTYVLPLFRKHRLRNSEKSKSFANGERFIKWIQLNVKFGVSEIWQSLSVKLLYIFPAISPNWVALGNFSHNYNIFLDFNILKCYIIIKC